MPAAVLAANRQFILTDGHSSREAARMAQESEGSNHGRPPVARWGTRIGVIFAVMGSAIGLGNFLRFPGLAAEYGGGHFMIPYFVAFVLLGLPIAWAEWSMGRLGSRDGFHSTPGIFYVLWKNRISPYFGVLGLIVPVGIYMYYVYIESWCLYYAIGYLNGDLSLGRDPSRYVELFSNYTGASENGALFDGGLSPAVWLLLFCFVLNFVIIYRGLNRGIELVSKYAIPFLFVCALVVLVRVLTLGTPDAALPEQNLLNGLGRMWNPGTEDKSLLESLANSEIWLAAAGQIFFSLSVGFGIIITYASYVRKNEDVLLSGTTSASGNLFAEVALGGMITIPAAFIFLGPSFYDSVGSTFTLGFMTFPNIFANMPLGNVMGFLWFMLLFVAAITSSLSMLQPAIAFFEEGLGMDRRASAVMLGFVTLVGSTFIVFFSKDFKALDVMDFWIGGGFIYLLATITVLIFGCGFGAEEGLAEAEKGSLMRVPRIFAFILRWVSPAFLLIVFGAWLYQKAGGYIELIQTDPVARLTIGMIGVLLVFFTLLVMVAVRRWRKGDEVSRELGLH